MFATPPVYSDVYNPSNFESSVQDAPLYTDYAKLNDANIFTYPNTFQKLFRPTSEQIKTVGIANGTSTTYSFDTLPFVIWRAAFGQTGTTTITLPPASYNYNGFFFYFMNYTTQTTTISVSGQTIIYDGVEVNNVIWNTANGTTIVFMIIKDKWCVLRNFG